MKKVVLNLSEDLQVTDNTGTYIGILSKDTGYEEYYVKDRLVLDLIKQGLTCDDIIKLKNNELI